MLIGIATVSGDTDPGKSGFHWLPNEGQWPEAVRYRAELPAGRLFLEKQGLTYAFLDAAQLKEAHHRKFYEGTIDGHAVKVRFQGANPDPEIKGSNPTSHYYNFFLGNNPERWATKVRGSRQVRYQELYNHIDLALFAQEGRLKYNFYVKPSGDPSAVTMSYEGADTVFLKDGHLHVQTSVNEFRELAPIAYQRINGEKQNVACDFELVDDQANTVRFVFPEGYESDENLVIDPKVIFSTFSGSLADNFGYTATFDSIGHGYSGGTVFGSKFPTTSGAFQENWSGGSNNTSGIGVGGARDVGLIKYNDSGTNVKYITYLGGTHNEDPHSMIVNDQGDLLVFGNTGSSDFPMAGNPYQDTLNGAYDMFIAKFSADGSTLKDATYLGGSNRDGLNGAQGFLPSGGYGNTSPLGFNYGDIFRGEVIVDNNDDVWVASVTKSSDFPVTNNVVQQTYGGGSQDACVTKLSADLSSMEYSTFLGGPEDDAAYSIAMAKQGGVYVAGGTESQQFPFNIQGHQTSNQGGAADGFAVHLSKNLSTLQGSTLLGTSGYDQIYFLQTGPKGDVYVTGQTNSNQFPDFNTNYSNADGKQFISKFNQDLDSLLWSAPFGSGKRNNPDLSPSAFLVDECGRIFFSGWGGGSNFRGHTGGLDVTPNAFQTVTDNSDFYLAVFARDMQQLLYGSYYGGGFSNEHVDGGTSRFDDNGIVYQSVCAGCGGYSDLPTTPNAWSSQNRGIRPNGDSTGCNNALLKIDLKAQDLFSGFEAPENSCFSDTVQFNNTSQLAESYYWDFGDGDTSALKSPAHQYDQPGTYEVTMVAENLNSCTVTDTVTDSIVIYDQAGAEFSYDSTQCPNAAKFEYSSAYGSDWYWEFGDSATSNEQNPVHTYDDTGWYEVSLIIDSGTACADTSSDSVRVDHLPEPAFDFVIDTCEGKLALDNQSRHADTFLWIFEDSVSRPQSDTGEFIHYYDDVGDLSATLVAQPGSHCADSLTKNFRLETPRVDFRPEVIDTCDFGYALIDESRFTNTGHWFLETGDTFQVQGDTLHYEFPGPGEYEIKMIADGPRSICVDSLTKTIEVDSLPDAEFSYEREHCASFIEVSNQSRHADNYQWDIQAINQPYDTAYKNPDTNRFFLPYSGELYEVSLIANPNSDCSDTFSSQIMLDSAAYADFDFAVDTCKSRVSFRNNSTRNANYQWDFGDDSTSGQNEPGHVYQDSGIYQVQLIVNAQGCSDTMEQDIPIIEVPKARFSLESEHCSSLLEIDNQSEYANRSYKWEIGADTVIYANIDEYRFRDTGTHQVRLVADPFGECPDTSRESIDIDEFADAAFEVMQDSCSGRVEFRHLRDSLGRFNWRFGTGDTSALHNPVYNYDTSGTFNVTLVNSMGNCSDTSQKPVTILNPQAEFVVDRQYCSPEVRFENLSKGADHQKWLFGDGSASFEANPEKIYQDTGRYEVKLVADHNSKCADTFAVSMHLDRFIRAGFDLIQDPCQPEVSLHNRSLMADSIRWSLGFEGAYQENADSLSNVEYPEPGRYQVKLMAANQECLDSAIQVIEVDSPVQAGFRLNQVPCMPKVALQDTSTRGNAIHWFFGDGAKQTGKRQPTHQYREAGLFTVMQVINPGGKCSDTARQQVEISIDDVKDVTIPNAFTPNGDGKNDEFVVKGLEGCDGYKIRIFNRWGDEVFRDSGRTLKWDGRDFNNGKPMRSGTYYYTLKNGDFKQEGTITLIR